jgi:hypothetical protein
MGMSKWAVLVLSALAPGAQAYDCDGSPAAACARDAILARAVAALRGAGWGVSLGEYRFDAIGHDSNPSGAYGLLAFDAADAFPPTPGFPSSSGLEFCDCIANHNETIAPACRALDAAIE